MIALPVPGTRLAGRYRLKDLLEQHALGGLFVAAYEPYETSVFMELMQPSAETAGEMRTLLGYATQMRSPNICGLIEWFEEGGFVCVATEHTAGVTLRELIDEVGSLPLSQGLEILGACVEAAGAAYGCGIYYLALEPRNLLITASGPVKLMRAGYSPVLEAGDAILRHEALLYRAPEALRGAPGRQSDVYAMAVMLREMLGPGRPTSLEAVLSKATALEPTSRPAARPFLETITEEANRGGSRARHEIRAEAQSPANAGFPRPEVRMGPVREGHNLRRYLIILAVLLAAAYLMARFIGGCRPATNDSLDAGRPLPVAVACASLPPLLSNPLT